MKQFVHNSVTIPLVRTKDIRPATQIAKEGEQLFLKGLVPATKDEIFYTRRITTSPGSSKSEPTLRTLFQTFSDEDIAIAPDVINRRRATVNITVTTVDDEFGKEQGKKLLKSAVAAVSANDCQEYTFSTTYSSLEQADVSAAHQNAVIAAMTP